MNAKWSEDSPSNLHGNFYVESNFNYNSNSDRNTFELNLEIGFLREYTNEVYKCITNSIKEISVYQYYDIPFSADDLYEYFCDLILSKFNFIEGETVKYGPEVAWFIPPLLAYALDLIDTYNDFSIYTFEINYSNQNLEIPKYMAKWGNEYPGLFHKFDISIKENKVPVVNLFNKRNLTIQVSTDKIRYMDLAALSLLGMSSYDDLQFVIDFSEDSLLSYIRYMASCVFPVNSTNDITLNSADMLEAKLTDYDVTSEYYLEIEKMKNEKEASIKEIALLHNNAIFHRIENKQFDFRKGINTIIDSATWFIKKILSEENFKDSFSQSTEIAEELVHKMSSRIDKANLLHIIVGCSKTINYVTEKKSEICYPDYIEDLRSLYGIRYVPKPNEVIKENLIEDYSSIVANRVLCQNLSIEEGTRVFTSNFFYFAASCTNKDEFTNIYNESETILKELINIINEIKKERYIIPYTSLVLALFTVIYSHAN